MRATLLLCCLLFHLLACNNAQKYDIKPEDKYEKGKVSLEEIEQKNPSRFLSVSGNSHKNIINQTVIKGKITNKAKIVTFKDINIKLSFYSKTGALLEQDDETVYETIHPGGTASFKSKFFAPKGTDSVAMKVTDAKF